ncbi:MAG: cysteine desulfurase [Bacteroidia bacterium]|nr:cysteine desulfurase [Bacteroidia bacterium]
MPYSLQNIRSQFPILASGKLVYLDSASTTQKPQVVIDAITRYYTAENANVHRGAYDLAITATEIFEGTREKIRRFIGAASPREIIFTKGTTESINLVAQSFVRPQLRPGDNVAISAMEHHANLVPWQILCKQQSAELRVAALTPSGELDLNHLAQLLDHRTRILALTHISNTLGTRNPVAEIIRQAHQKNIPVLLDAAQSIAHEAVDVGEMDCDFMAFSGHKMYGPTGIGVFYGKEKYLETMEPYQFGGEMIRTVTFADTTYNQLPWKFEAGTPHIAGAAGLGAAVDFLENIGRENIRQYEHDLLHYATRRLSEVEGLNIIGKAPEKGGILSFTWKNVHPHDISTILNESGIAIRAGHHCTQPLMQLLGLPGTARVSLGVYNTTEDIDRLIAALEKVRGVFG